VDSSATEQFTVNYNVTHLNLQSFFEGHCADNPQFETVERADPITGIISIHVYNLLNFSNINWVDTDPDFDGNHLGLAPHTYPDAATFGAGTNTLLLQNPVITAGYIESTVDSFTPRSWWYGCVLPSPHTAGSLPISCNSKISFSLAEVWTDADGVVCPGSHSHRIHQERTADCDPNVSFRRQRKRCPRPELWDVQGVR
jgi:hypothetical protein